MDLSVIIVSYRGWGRLSRCLDALSAFNLRSFSMEVVVVDNNSGDGIINDFEKKFSRFRFIKNSINGGYAYGCNRGAETSNGDFLMILNPDTVVSEKEIGKLLVNAKRHPDHFILSCRQVREDGKGCMGAGKFPGLSSGNLFPFKPDSDLTFPDWVSGSLMLFRRETYTLLNGFDESFWMYYEDVDICKRARNAGGVIAFYNDIVIEHNHGGSTRINLQVTSVTKCEVQISRHVFIRKHYNGLKRFLLQFLSVADNIVTGTLTGVLGLVFFFVPKLFVRSLIMFRMTKYYFGAMKRRSWISPRSVMYRKQFE